MKLTKQQFVEKVLPNLPDNCIINYDNALITDRGRVKIGNLIEIAFEENFIHDKYESEFEKKIFGE